MRGITKEKKITNKRVILFQNIKKNRFDAVQKVFSFMQEIWTVVYNVYSRIKKNSCVYVYMCIDGERRKKH